MFVEYKKLRQNENDYRRLFSDNVCDIYLWYDNDKDMHLIGFQIVNKTKNDAKALTWTKEKGFYHLAVNEEKSWYAQTPLLVENGVFEYSLIKNSIKKNIEEIEEKDLKFALEKIREYGERQEF